MAMNAAQMVKALTEKFRDAVAGTTEFRGEHSLTVKLESLSCCRLMAIKSTGNDMVLAATMVISGK